MFFDCTINISNYKKPELAIDCYVPWKLTPKSAMTMSYSLDQQFFFPAAMAEVQILASQACVVLVYIFRFIRGRSILVYHSLYSV